MVRTADRSPRSGAAFRVALHPERDCVRVVAAGDLDVATSPALEARLRELREAGFGRIVLDLRELHFLGSAGLRLLVQEHELARRDGHEFALVAGPPAIQRAVQLCGLLDHLPFVAPHRPSPIVRARRDHAGSRSASAPPGP
ncbi:MAG: STAS domain-containing protein [Solirubrobacteraceae bacterium]|nr:STAS domain-containing protein [Solirubrobacteraceae bacterium]